MLNFQHLAKILTEAVEVVGYIAGNLTQRRSGGSMIQHASTEPPIIGKVQNMLQPSDETAGKFEDLNERSFGKTSKMC